MGMSVAPLISHVKTGVLGPREEGDLLLSHFSLLCVKDPSHTDLPACCLLVLSYPWAQFAQTALAPVEKFIL